MMYRINYWCYSVSFAVAAGTRWQDSRSVPAERQICDQRRACYQSDDHDGDLWEGLGLKVAFIDLIAGLKETKCAYGHCHES